MKTFELISGLLVMGYQVKVNAKLPVETVIVYTPEGKYAGKVCTKLFGVLSTATWVNTSGKSSYDTGDVNNLVDVLMTYALTPLDKREDTKKYLVKMLPNEENYLNQSTTRNHIFFSTSDEAEMYKTQFTEEEYNKLQEQYTNWLPKFDKDDPHFVEVPIDYK